MADARSSLILAKHYPPIMRALCFKEVRMPSIIPAAFNSLIAGLNYLRGKEALDEKKAKERDEAIDVVLEAAVLTKGYLYNRRELDFPQDRDKEQEISQTWQKAANSIYHFDEKLLKAAQIKALSWADPREWVKAEQQNITVKLDKVIEQCNWLKSN